MPIYSAGAASQRVHTDEDLTVKIQIGQECVAKDVVTAHHPPCRTTQPLRRADSDTQPP